MARQIFINLPVSDLEKSLNFYSALGFTNNPQFSDDSAKCMVWSDHIFVMLLRRERFETFATKPLSDPSATVAGLYSLSMESVDEMNKVLENGLNAGGKEPHEMRDHGFMQERSIEDPDGHTWEIFYMDLSKLPQE